MYKMTVPPYTVVSYSVSMPECDPEDSKNDLRKSSKEYTKCLGVHDKSKRINRDLKAKKRKYDSNEPGDNKYETNLSGVDTIVGSDLNVAKVKEALESAKEALKSDANLISEKIEELRDFIGTIGEATDEINDKKLEAAESIKELREKIKDLRAEMKALAGEVIEELETDISDSVDDIDLWNEYLEDMKGDIQEKMEDKEKVTKWIKKLQEIYKTYYTNILKKPSDADVEPIVVKYEADDVDDEDDMMGDDDDDDDDDNQVTQCETTLVDKLLGMLNNKNHHVHSHTLKALLKKCLKLSLDLEKKTGCVKNPLTTLLHTKLQEAIDLC